jgi:hypothetical protein
MAKSSAQKGAYYKARTREWYGARGWQIVDLEIVKWIHSFDKKTGEPIRIPVKRDQMGSDLMVVNKAEIHFLQVKLNRNNISQGKREFWKHVFPPLARRFVVVWIPRARDPELVEVFDPPPVDVAPVTVEDPNPSPKPRRTKAPRTTLF